MSADTSWAELTFSYSAGNGTFLFSFINQFQFLQLQCFRQKKGHHFIESFPVTFLTSWQHLRSSLTFSGNTVYLAKPKVTEHARQQFKSLFYVACVKWVEMRM